MPKKYEKIRDSMKSQGKSDRKAKEIAAKTFNANRKPGQKPVTRKGK